MSEYIQLIVGLGNPGKEYAATRHNVGTWWLHKLCEKYPANFQLQSKLNASVANINIDNIKVRCAISTTYINDSGLALANLCNYYQIAAANVLIIHDELAFAAGELRLKFGGGHNGHNGLRSIASHLGSEFYRLRIGIGHPGHKDLVSDYVLSAPGKDDFEKINTGIENNLKGLSSILNKVI